MSPEHDEDMSRNQADNFDINNLKYNDSKLTLKR